MKNSSSGLFMNFHGEVMEILALVRLSGFMFRPSHMELRLYFCFIFSYTLFLYEV